MAGYFACHETVFSMSTSRVQLNASLIVRFSACVRV